MFMVFLICQLLKKQLRSYPFGHTGSLKLPIMAKEAG